MMVPCVGDRAWRGWAAVQPGVGSGEEREPAGAGQPGHQEAGPVTHRQPQDDLQPPHSHRSD